MKIFPLLLVLGAMLLTSCSSNSGKTKPGMMEENHAKSVERRRELTLEAGELYKLARQSMESGDYSKAVERYDLISVRYPFTDYATQSELERVYALYRNYEPDKALSAAERFAREHPRHPAMDYVQYVKGLTNYSRDMSPMHILPTDESKSDVGSFRRAFDDFQVLIQKYPKSRYAGDAYERMIFLRNRIAEHEMHVVDFYIRRGAYIAAAKRAEQIISLYPGSPSSYKALESLVTAYDLAKLDTQAADARRLLDAQDWVKTSSAVEAPRPAVAEMAPPAPMWVADAATAASDAVPAATATAEASTDAASPAAEKKGGFFTWFAGLFSGLDSSRPGTGYEIVIPSGTKTASTTPAAVTTAAVETKLDAAEPAKIVDKAAPDAQQPSPHGLKVFFEPYDDEVQQKPGAPAGASPAS